MNENLNHEQLKNLGVQMDRKEIFDKKVTRLISNETFYAIINSSNAHSNLTAEQEAEFFYKITKYCANTRNYFLVSFGMVAATLQKFGSEQQKEEYCKNFYKDKLIASLAITEPSGGSNLREVSTTYQQSGNKFKLNGIKRWITFGGIADLILVVANGDAGLLVFCLDPKTHKYSTKQMSGLIGNRASHIAELELINTIAEKKDILGGCFKNSKQALAFSLMNGRAIAAVAATAMAEAALEEAIQYAKSSNKTILEHQLVQQLLADSKVMIATSKSCCIDAFKYKRRGDIEAASQCAIAKIHASRIVQEVIRNSMQIVGGNSLLSDYNLERYYREAKAFEYIEGSTQVLTQLVARSAILGLPRLWKK